MHVADHLGRKMISNWFEFFFGLWKVLKVLMTIYPLSKATYITLMYIDVLGFFLVSPFVFSLPKHINTNHHWFCVNLIIWWSFLVESWSIKGFGTISYRVVSPKCWCVLSIKGFWFIPKLVVLLFIVVVIIYFMIVSNTTDY